MPEIYLYILVMAAITYLIRVLPFIIFRREIRNRYIRSFLFYVPYATLAAMTVPAVFYATGSMIAGGAAFGCAVLFALRGKSLFVVSVAACLTALAADLILACIPMIGM